MAMFIAPTSPLLDARTVWLRPFLSSGVRSRNVCAFVLVLVIVISLLPIGYPTVTAISLACQHLLADLHDLRRGRVDAAHQRLDVLARHVKDFYLLLFDVR